MTLDSIPKMMTKNRMKYYKLSTYVRLDSAQEYADNHDIGYKKLIRKDTRDNKDYYTVYSVKNQTKRRR